MNTNEFRLGNLLTLKDKVRQELFNNEIHARNKYFKVLSIYSYGDILLELDDENIEIDIKDIEPIPLTEERLVNLGFEVFEFDHKENQYSFNGRLIVVRNGEFYEYGTNVNLKFVHKTQNLMFELTGKELTFKS